MRKILTSFVILTLFAASCNRETRDPAIDSFDIDDSIGNIVFEVNHSIYTTNIKSGVAKSILKASSDCYYSSPRLTDDAKAIYFIKRAPGDYERSTIYKGKFDGSELDSVATMEGIVTELLVWPGTHEIIYCRAKSYGSYSPIGVAGPHDMDVYAFDLATHNIRQLTSINAYEIDNINIVEGRVVFYLDEVASAGLKSVDLYNPGELIGIIPSNNPRGDSALYYSAVYAESSSKIILRVPYQIYAMDVSSGQATLIYNGMGKGDIDGVRVQGAMKRILFSRATDGLRLSIIGIDGKHEDKLDLVIQ